jgi:hypothetical protein
MPDRSAVFSDCGRYRYRLDRVIGEGPPVAFVLHNPSTAGVEIDDRTSRRGIGYAKTLGFGRLIFVNPWAYIATKPADLWAAQDPIGPLNDAHIQGVLAEVLSDGGRIVAAWGRINPPARWRPAATARIADVVRMVRRGGSELFALGVNQDGSPGHPLYLRKDATLTVWREGDSHE